MNKRYVLILILAGNSCFAVPDEQKLFFHVADQQNGATKIIALHFVHMAKDATLRESMALIAKKANRYMVSPIYSRLGLSGEIRVTNNRGQRNLRIEARMRATRELYEKYLQSDSFTQTRVLRDLPDQQKVDIECEGYIPKSAYWCFVK